MLKLYRICSNNNVNVRDSVDENYMSTNKNRKYRKIPKQYKGRSNPDEQNMISCFNTSIRSIRNKCNEFIALIGTEQPDIIAITDLAEWRIRLHRRIQYLQMGIAS